MRYYAEFYYRNWRGNVLPVCGSDGVLPIDGRVSLENAHGIAVSQMEKHGFEKYKITKANSLREVE